MENSQPNNLPATERSRTAIRQTVIPIVAIFLLVAAGVYINIRKEIAKDNSRIPEKVSESRDFQRWSTNLKNKGVIIDSGDFFLYETSEIYNSRWLNVYSIEEEGMQEQFEQTLAEHQELKGVAFSPSKRVFVDYRNMERNGYLPNEAHLYGLRDNKVINARILECVPIGECYFDRAYFLDNDVFVISEISRDIKPDMQAGTCDIVQPCKYLLKVHVIDLLNNKRTTYRSPELDMILENVVPDFQISQALQSP